MKIVVNTVTCYKSLGELRFRLAEATILAARSYGLDIVMVDGSPDPAIPARFRELGAQVFPELHRGMGPCKRQATFHAAEVAGTDGVIFWIEAEKHNMIRFTDAVMAPIQPGQADIVIPNRTQASWDSYPEFQRTTEQQANRAYREAFGWDFDVMFGPVAYRASLARHFLLLRPDDFGLPDTYIHHYGPPSAIAGGGMVTSFPVNFIYPPEQRQEEETTLSEAIKAKRIQQRDSLIAAYQRLAERIGA